MIQIQESEPAHDKKCAECGASEASGRSECSMGYIAVASW